MKRTFVLIAAACAAVAATGVFAQSPRSPAYDVKSEVVLKGRVVEVKAISDWMGTRGVNVVLQTSAASPIHVDTAPEDFLQLLDFAVAAGDDIDVTGVWSTWDGHPVFLARRLNKARVTVAVRDSAGKPVW